MKLIVTIALTAMLAASAATSATANSIDYYNRYGSNCDTPSKAC
ncbi:hypothetical protein [Methylocystis parvus]